MSRPIDADALIEELKSDRFPGAPYVGVGLKIAIEKICEAPTIEPERKKGKWERHYSRPNVYADLCWHCSVCGYKTAESWANHFKFCPECGSYNGSGNYEV